MSRLLEVYHSWLIFGKYPVRILHAIFFFSFTDCEFVVLPKNMPLYLDHFYRTVSVTILSSDCTKTNPYTRYVVRFPTAELKCWVCDWARPDYWVVPWCRCWNRSLQRELRHWRLAGNQGGAHSPSDPHSARPTGHVMREIFHIALCRTSDSRGIALRNGVLSADPLNLLLICILA